MPFAPAEPQLNHREGPLLICWPAAHPQIAAQPLSYQPSLPACGAPAKPYAPAPHLALRLHQVVLTSRQAKQVGREPRGCRRAEQQKREAPLGRWVWRRTRTACLQACASWCDTRQRRPCTIHRPTRPTTHAPLKTMRKVMNSQDTANSQNWRTRSREGGPWLASCASGCEARGEQHMFVCGTRPLKCMQRNAFALCHTRHAAVHARSPAEEAARQVATHLDQVLVLLGWLLEGPGKEDGHQQHQHKGAPACAERGSWFRLAAEATAVARRLMLCWPGLLHRVPATISCRAAVLWWQRRQPITEAPYLARCTS